ncbi:hypothetical protein, partial [Escherichia coli]
DKGWDARKRAYCLKIQPATGSFARNLIYSTKPPAVWSEEKKRRGPVSISSAHLPDYLRRCRRLQNFGKASRRI